MCLCLEKALQNVKNPPTIISLGKKLDAKGKNQISGKAVTRGNKPKGKTWKEEDSNSGSEISGMPKEIAATLELEKDKETLLGIENALPEDGEKRKKQADQGSSAWSPIRDKNRTSKTNRAQERVHASERSSANWSVDD